MKADTIEARVLFEISQCEKYGDQFGHRLLFADCLREISRLKKLNERRRKLLSKRVAK